VCPVIKLRFLSLFIYSRFAAIVKHALNSTCMVLNETNFGLICLCLLFSVICKTLRDFCGLSDIICTCMIGNRTVESRGSFSSLNKQKDMGICLAGNGLIVFTIYMKYIFLQLFHFYHVMQSYRMHMYY